MTSGQGSPSLGQPPVAGVAVFPRFQMILSVSGEKGGAVACSKLAVTVVLRGSACKLCPALAPATSRPDVQRSPVRLVGTNSAMMLHSGPCVAGTLVASSHACACGAQA